MLVIEYSFRSKNYYKILSIRRSNVQNALVLKTASQSLKCIRRRNNERRIIHSIKLKSKYSLKYSFDAPMVHIIVMVSIYCCDIVYCIRHSIIIVVVIVLLLYD
jgi:hypothetical protein